jgi:hypothetical protein
LVFDVERCLVLILQDFTLFLRFTGLSAHFFVLQLQVHKLFSLLNDVLFKALNVSFEWAKGGEGAGLDFKLL